MDDIQGTFAELMVSPDKAEAARELQPMSERVLFGRHIFLFKNASREQLKELGEVRTPGVADLFVATMTGGAS